MTSTEMLRYLEKHRVPGAQVAALPESDAALTQAIIDGYAAWDGVAWLLKGRIKPGERRVVRFDDGTSMEVVG